MLCKMGQKPARPQDVLSPAPGDDMTRRTLADRALDLLPLLALIAAGLGLLIPSATIAGGVDVLLALLVFVTEIGRASCRERV